MSSGPHRVAALFAALIAAGLSACAPRKPPVVLPDTSSYERLAAADANVREGCLDCLIAALREYEALRAVPAREPVATIGAIRAAALIALRERELGMLDEGYLERARDLIASVPDPAMAARLGAELDVAELQVDRTRFERADSVETNAARGRQAAARRAAILDGLRPDADLDPLSAYLWVGFNCAYGTGAIRTRLTASTEAIPSWRDTPLLRFKTLTCGDIDEKAFRELAAEDSRFVEMRYFTGAFAMGAGEIDTAVEQFDDAHAWHPRWPSLAVATAQAWITVEEFDPAAVSLEEALAARPDDPSVLLTYATVLNNLNRQADSLVAVDRLLALDKWYIGDARYLRALNEYQLDRPQEAWADIELAQSMRVDASVFKLAGLIAYKLRQLETARVKLDTALVRDPGDCQTAFYLGIVEGELGAWDRAVVSLTSAESCLTTEQLQLRREIARIAALIAPADRKARQIAARERVIGNNERTLANAWFNLAAGCYNLARKDEARAFAERVRDDVELGPRAKELLALINVVR